ncbi:hypothetical protein ACFSQD_00200 [Flavihumibacter stibioxidans]|nr:hypothetical protein [Flavihumibacter stibioxidans]
MKTSNKIMIGLLLVLIAIPASIMVAFSYKIKNDDFVILMWDQEARSVQPVKNAACLKLQAPEGVELQCTIRYADSIYYKRWNSTQNDSLFVSNIGDTLLFRYLPVADEPSQEERGSINVEIFLPFQGLLMIDGADVTLDSIGASQNITVNMENNALLQIGNLSEKLKRIDFGMLSVEAENSQVTVHPGAEVREMNLTLSGRSVLSIDSAARIGLLQGSVSAASRLNGEARYLYRLKAEE